jgi:branched-chain amino acid transport system permease protein
VSSSTSSWTFSPAFAGKLALVVLVAALPPFFGSYYNYLWSLCLINIIVAVGLNLLTGNAGQISLCHSSFMAIGAYTSTYLQTKTGLSFWLAMPLGGVVAALFGLALGFPALRLRGFYLAVVTLGFLEMSTLFITELPSITGGVRGVSSPRPSLFGFLLSSDLSFFYVVFAVMLATIWLAYSLLHSPTGRALNAIRNSEAAAQTLAVPLARIKLVVFMISAFLAGVGGGLFASLVGFIDPLEFGLSTSVRYIIIIVIGGLGSIAGSIVGAVMLTILPEVLRDFKEYNELVFGVLLLVTLIVIPHGFVSLAPMIRARLGGVNQPKPALGKHGAGAS